MVNLTCFVKPLFATWFSLNVAQWNIQNEIDPFLHFSFPSNIVYRQSNLPHDPWMLTEQLFGKIIYGWQQHVTSQALDFLNNGFVNRFSLLCCCLTQIWWDQTDKIKRFSSLKFFLCNWILFHCDLHSAPLVELFSSICPHKSMVKQSPHHALQGQTLYF